MELCKRMQSESSATRLRSPSEAWANEQRTLSGLRGLAKRTQGEGALATRQGRANLWRKQTPEYPP